MIKKEELLDILFSKDTFYLSIVSDSTLPVTHPDFYKYHKFIEVTEAITDCELGEEKYKVNENIYQKVKEYTNASFETFLSIATKQSEEFYVGGGTLVVIKCSSRMVILDRTTLLEEHQKILDAFIDKIISIIKEG